MQKIQTPGKQFSLILKPNQYIVQSYKTNSGSKHHNTTLINQSHTKSLESHRIRPSNQKFNTLRKMIYKVIKFNITIIHTTARKTQ